MEDRIGLALIAPDGRGRDRKGILRRDSEKGGEEHGGAVVLSG